MSQETHTLWQERYRPKNVNQIILPPKVKKFVKNIVESKVLPNLILYYPKPGNGKTSLARALCNDLQIEHVLHINASLNANIDLLRTDITDFASVWSMDGKVKVVILEEMENATLAFQNALKDFSETYSEACRFIMTTNNISKIIEPLRSRFKIVDFDFENIKVRQEMIPKIKNDFLIKMLKREKISFKEEVVNELVERCYPDIRWMIKSLQCEFIENGEITENVIRLTSVDREFYDMILSKKMTDARKYLIEKQVSYGEMYSKLFREFLPLIESKPKQANVILAIAESMDKHTRSIDVEITFVACLVNIMTIL
jgi:replication factor C small subunit